MVLRCGAAPVLRRPGAASSSGRECRSHLNFGAAKWARFGCSPIWLSFDDRNYGAVATALRAGERQLYEDEGRCHVPIVLPTGVERGEVIDAALQQLLAIAETLPRIAVADAMPSPDEAASL